MVAVWCTVVSISPMWTWVRRHFWVPNQQRTLNKLPAELQRRNFVNNHRLGMQIGTKHAKTCMRSVCIPTELPFCLPPLVVGHFFVGCFPAPITRIPPSSFSPPPPEAPGRSVTNLPKFGKRIGGERRKKRPPEKKNFFFPEIDRAALMNDHILTALTGKKGERDWV